ncbi:hypothetical protein Trydic_g6934 [Trypoxylus dichotomus]
MTRPGNFCAIYSQSGSVPESIGCYTNRVVDLHYIRKDWVTRVSFRVGETNVQKPPLVESHIPLLHNKLSFMKNPNSEKFLQGKQKQVWGTFYQVIVNFIGNDKELVEDMLASNDYGECFHLDFAKMEQRFNFLFAIFDEVSRFLVYSKRRGLQKMYVLISALDKYRCPLGPPNADKCEIGQFESRKSLPWFGAVDKAGLRKPWA